MQTKTPSKKLIANWRSSIIQTDIKVTKTRNRQKRNLKKFLKLMKYSLTNKNGPFTISLAKTGSKVNRLREVQAGFPVEDFLAVDSQQEPNFPFLLLDSMAVDLDLQPRMTSFVPFLDLRVTRISWTWMKDLRQAGSQEVSLVEWVVGCLNSNFQSTSHTLDARPCQS